MRRVLYAGVTFRFRAELDVIVGNYSLLSFLMLCPRLQESDTWELDGEFWVLRMVYQTDALALGGGKSLTPSSSGGYVMS